MGHALSGREAPPFFPSKQHEDEQKAKTCLSLKNNDPVAPSLYQGPHKSCDTVTAKEDTSIEEEIGDISSLVSSVNCRSYYTRNLT
jgi:hypothetical protein